MLLCLLVVLPFTAESRQPHILHILVDDFGWADAGWHRPSGYTDLQSPNMDSLVKAGVELNRHYVFKVCSPTRSAVQSGRNPIHVSVLNLLPNVRNASDPVSGYAGIPRDMTGMAEHLLRAGYETHMYGKWDAGMATPQHTPHGRGYQKSLHYFNHANDYWTSTSTEPHMIACNSSTTNESVPIVDLWDTTRPARGQNNTATCSQEHQEGCIYEDQLFANAVIAAIENRDLAKPLFIFWAPHSVHTPYQVPQKELSHFSFIKDYKRQFYHAMVFFVDEAIGNVTRKIKEAGMWNDTLIVLHGDNGGPVNRPTTQHAGNNFPLRGGKFSNFEGGIRVNAFVSGGFLPSNVRGTKHEGLMAGWDWYATFAALAGVDPQDTRAAAAGLPPVDSYNLWPALSGQTLHSPRKELAIGDSEIDSLDDRRFLAKGQARTIVAGLLWGQHKLLIGKVKVAGWTGPVYPNTTSNATPSDGPSQECGLTADSGCLYDVASDPTEHNNIAKVNANLFEQMLARVAELQKSAFSPMRGTEDPVACRYALEHYGGFWGPFVDVDEKASADSMV